MHLKPGYQLTAEALNRMIDVFRSFRSAGLKTVTGGRLGLVPGYGNHVRGTFVRDTFEVEIKDLMALLPDGNIINVDQSAVVKIPLLYGDVYYLTVYKSDEVIYFEAEEIPFVRNGYSFSISTYEELEQNCGFPIMRFVVRDGSFSVDDNFMMPCLTTDMEPRMKEWFEKLADAAAVVLNHPNLAKNIYQAMFNYVFRLKVIGDFHPMTQAYALLSELASAINFFILKPNVDSPEEVVKVSLYDPEKWFTWLLGYFDRAVKVLDGVVLEEEKIDLESIKQELRAEIYDHIQPDLEKMVNERVDSLSEALQTRVEDVLKDYVSGKIRGELHDELCTELDAEIRSSLYADLYQALYSVLFVPKEEEDNSFTPLI